MVSRLENIISAYTKKEPGAEFVSIYKVFLVENLCVPVSRPAHEIRAGVHDISCMCIRMSDGTGALPVFTTMDHLLQWKPGGCLYITLTGRSVVGMAIGMDSISEITINPGSAPRGRIPRADFARMLALES